jgi:hypothetical protein
MFTSFMNEAVEKEAIAAGCSRVLSKSDSYNMLVENIERLLPGGPRSE